MNVVQEMAHGYIVLGDVVQSRNIEERNEFQTRLEDACQRVNESFEPGIVADFKLLKGIDEIGGVLRTPVNVYDIARVFTEEIRPYQLRLAVVFGSVDVGWTSKDVSKMDGPAFHRADELLNSVESNDLLFDMKAGINRLDTSVSDEINLLLLRRQGWTERQRELIETYREHGTQEDVAKSLDITQQAVSKTLNRASWPMIETIEGRLRSTLEEIERKSTEKVH